MSSASMASITFLLSSSLRFVQRRGFSPVVDSPQPILQILMIQSNLPNAKIQQVIKTVNTFHKKMQFHRLLLLFSNQQKHAKGQFICSKYSQEGCRNSINDNKKMLYPNSKLAWIHFNNTKSKEQVVVQQFDPSLKKMYEGQIRFDTIQRLNKEMAYSHIQKFGGCQLVIYLQENIEKYGDKYNVRCQSLEDICEREIEMIEETQKETQIQAAGLEAIGQYSGINIFKGSISSLDIELDRRLIFTSNFIKCTKSKAYYYNYRAGEEDNQLSHVHFVLIKPIEKQMIVLTQREANSKIQQGICCLGPQNVDDCQEREFIVRFADLSIRSLIVSKFSLERALTDAQFFNGKQNFQNKQLIFQTIRKNYKQLQLIQIERIVWKGEGQLKISTRVPTYSKCSSNSSAPNDQHQQITSFFIIIYIQNISFALAIKRINPLLSANRLQIDNINQRRLMKKQQSKQQQIQPNLKKNRKSDNLRLPCIRNGSMMIVRIDSNKRNHIRIKQGLQRTIQ